MFTKHRLAVAAGLASIALVISLGIAGAAAPQRLATTTTSVVASCTTDSNGYCTVPHTLGAVPTTVLLTPASAAGATPYVLSAVAGQATATTVKVRAVKVSNGAALANTAITFSMLVLGSAPPTTTTPPVTTTTTPPATTTTTTTPPPAGCPLPAYPDASCTGVPTGAVLTAYTGPADIRVADTVIDSVTISSCMSINAPGVVIKNSRINAPNCAPHVIYNNAADIYHNGYTGTGLVIQDSEISCYETANGQPDLTRPTNGTALGDDNVTALRLNVHGCENGFDLDVNATVRGSYVHDLLQSEAAHTDGLQSADGSGLTLDHNTFYGDTWSPAVFGAGGCVNPGFCAGTSAVNINNCNPAQRPCPTTVNALIQDNLFAGGAYTLYCPFLVNNVQITNNHFSYKFRDPASTTVYDSAHPFAAPPWKPGVGPGSGAFGPVADCNNGEVTSGNVFDGTNPPVPVQF